MATAPQAGEAPARRTGGSPLHTIGGWLALWGAIMALEAGMLAGSWSGGADAAALRAAVLDAAAWAAMKTALVAGAAAAVAVARMRIVAQGCVVLFVIAYVQRDPAAGAAQGMGRHMLDHATAVAFALLVAGLAAQIVLDELARAVARVRQAGDRTRRHGT